MSLAELPKVPYFPKRPPLLAAALTLALMLGILAALRCDVTDGTVRRTQELEALTMVPVLGICPALNRTRHIPRARVTRVQHVHGWRNRPGWHITRARVARGLRECMRKRPRP